MRWAATVAMVAAAGLAVPQATTTRVHTYRPWTAAGALAPGIRVAGTVHGTCWSPSIAVSSADAYRCMSGNSILDPCFAKSATVRTGQLACATDPWSKVTLLDLSRRIGRGAVHSNGKRIVWADRLANGVRCTLATGTGVLVGKLVLNYDCAPGRGWASFPSTRRQPWTVHYAARPSAGTVSTVAVRSAWY